MQRMRALRARAPRADDCRARRITSLKLGSPLAGRNVLWGHSYGSVPLWRHVNCAKSARLLPYETSCQPRQKARAVRVCGNHTWYPELKTARARSSYGRCIRRSGQRPGGSLGATPADQARLNPSVKPELSALTPQRAAWLSAVVDADEHPANPPSSKLAATCNVRHCSWRIQAPAMGLS